MTKKQFIWLGIRTIGLYWLIKLLFSVLALIATTGFMIELLTDSSQQFRFRYSTIWLTQLIFFLTGLALTIYFLFFGELVYKFIDHSTKSQQEDLSKPTGYCYCEIIVRFAGLWYVGTVVSRFSLSLVNTIQAILTSLGQLQKHGISTFFTKYLNPETLLWTALFFIPTVILAWYFLKHGKFLINLLNRLWLKATPNNLTQTP